MNYSGGVYMIEFTDWLHASVQAVFDSNALVCFSASDDNDDTWANQNV